jgi:PBP1b-binding outer membrane lipoprotein LpoB
MKAILAAVLLAGCSAIHPKPVPVQVNAAVAPSATPQVVDAVPATAIVPKTLTEHGPIPVVKAVNIDDVVKLANARKDELRKCYGKLDAIRAKIKPKPKHK